MFGQTTLSYKFGRLVILQSGLALPVGRNANRPNGEYRICFIRNKPKAINNVKDKIDRLITFPVEIKIDGTQVYLIDLVKDEYNVDIPVERVDELQYLDLMEILEQYKCTRRLEVL